MLTDTEIRRAIRGATTDKTLNDHTAGRGAGSLRLRIRPGIGGASATWLAFWKRDGERAMKPLGRYPATSAAEARRIYRDDVVPVLLAGKDPRVTVAQAERPTVGRLFQAYADHMRAIGRESAGEVERLLLLAKNNAADALGRNRLAAQIEPGDVVGYLAKFHQRGRAGAADKARSYIQSAYNWALKAAHDYTVQDRQDWGVKANPVAVVARDREATTQRERNLSAAELAVLWRAATPGQNGFTLETAGVIRLLIATGQRVQEVLRLDGAELDLPGKLWAMPREKTKLRLRPHAVPLPAQVLPVLAALVERHGAGPLFPARKGSARARMDHRSVKQAIDRWLALEGVTAAQFQTRDLRRTWKSRTGEIGISREMRDLIQQHAKHDTGSLHYDRADYLPQMRDAMGRWEAWLSGVVGAG